MSKRRDDKLHLDRLITNIRFSGSHQGDGRNVHYYGKPSTIGLRGNERRRYRGSSRSHRLRRKILAGGSSEVGVVRSGAQPTLFPISRGRRKEDLAAAVRLFIPRTLDELIRGIGRAIYDELARLQYLGPLRSYPPRHLAFSQYHDPNWYAGGGYAWDVVRETLPFASRSTRGSQRRAGFRLRMN